MAWKYFRNAYVKQKTLYIDKAISVELCPKWHFFPLRHPIQTVPGLDKQGNQWKPNEK